MKTELTRTEHSILKFMSKGEEMIVSGGQVWVGEVRTNHQLFYSLLRKMAISISCETANSEYWEINETGENLIKQLKSW